MRCPTCGRRVGRDQETCAFCGAYVRDALASASGMRGPVAATETKPTRSPVLTPAQPPVPDKYPAPAETFEPELEEFEEVASEQGPGEATPTTPPASPPPGQPRYAGLLRILFPLLFILIPLYNLLVRNAPFDSDERPALQETQFFENIAGGRLVNPQKVFSRSRHQRVVLFARWSGSRGRHSYTFRWFTPQGNPLPVSSSITRFQFGSGDDAFSAYTVLPLTPGLPTGTWRVEIAVDQEVQGKPTFELRE